MVRWAAAAILSVVAGTFASAVTATPGAEPLSTKMQLFDPAHCCVCASWLKKVESFERKTCVPGCDECGCEACICSDPCDYPVESPMIDRGEVAFSGRHLVTKLGAGSEIEIINPEAITLGQIVTARSTERGDKAFFGWVSRGTAVILEQPRGFPPPRYDESARAISIDSPETCRICGTHPHSQADLDAFECVPGAGDCYRCISWGCATAQLGGELQ